MNRSTFNPTPGEVWLSKARLIHVDTFQLFDPKMKIRPVLVVGKQYADRVQIVPGSSKSWHVLYTKQLMRTDYPFLDQDTKFLAFEAQNQQIGDFLRKIGVIREDDLQEIVEYVRLAFL